MQLHLFKLDFALIRPGRRIGELHLVLGLEDLGPVNLQRLMGANEVSYRDGVCLTFNLSKLAIG